MPSHLLHLSPVGRGRAEGAGEGARAFRESLAPSPHPSPQRGEGADRVRSSTESFFLQGRTRGHGAFQSPRILNTRRNAPLPTLRSACPDAARRASPLPRRCPDQPLGGGAGL